MLFVGPLTLNYKTMDERGISCLVGLLGAQVQEIVLGDQLLQLRLQAKKM